jgi:hypothetical protein
MEGAIEAIKASFSLDAGLLVHIATLGYVLGFLLKNQLLLRFLVLGSTVLYIVYYYIYPAQPLWAAIMGSVLLIIANIIGTLSIIYDRLPIKIDPKHLPIYHSLQGIRPGEFRRLIKVAEYQTTEGKFTLTHENEAPSHLYYLEKGTGEAEKKGSTFTIPEGRFVGEISFILGGNATATVNLAKGSTFLSWEKTVLNKLLDKHPNLQRAFEARIARDMASKLASANSIKIDNSVGLN